MGLLDLRGGRAVGFAGFANGAGLFAGFVHTVANPSKSDDAFAAFWNSAGGLAGFVHSVANPSKSARTVRILSKHAPRFAGFVRSVANLSKPSRTVRKPSKPSLRRAAVRRTRSLGVRSWQAFAETLHVSRRTMRAAAALRWRTGGRPIRQCPQVSSNL